MSNKNQHHPPRWATRILHWYCKSELVEDLEGDLCEYFDRNSKSLGKKRAQLIYVLDVLKFFRIYTVRKFKPLAFIGSIDLWQNNFKTTLRNIRKNSLFAFINITGLAVSMCVGLIVIALVLEMKSFDTFHENHDLIFRVRNNLIEPNSGKEEYASTSLLAAKQIKERVTGIEASTIIRRGFDKDVSYNGKTIPLNGLWADESFFNVFTFEVLAGNVFSALKDPNSIVLTEKSALKLFNSIDILDQVVVIDSTNYVVNAIIKDPPLNSHLRFDILGSFVTIDNQKSIAGNLDWMKWDEMWATYLYVIIPKQESVPGIQQSLSIISKEGNKTIDNHIIELQLQPLNEIVLGYGLSMEIGPSGNKVILWTLGIFAAIIIISACFNYTNLSIARALRRTREVGIRKVVGASRMQVVQQFLLESIVISLISLVLSFLLFLIVRDQFISMDATFQEMVTLQPSSQVYIYFIVLAVVVGLLAGLLPAWFFSKTDAMQVLKSFSSITLFRHINLRKGLIIFQYSLSLLFVVAVSLEYKQYQYALSFDLGFNTNNILTVDMQQNNPLLMEKVFREVAEVRNLSKSNYISSIGASNAFGSMKYIEDDSIKLHFNYVDENYIPLHDHKLLAGRNFTSSMIDDSYVIVNEKAVEWMQLSNPFDAIDEVILLEGKEMRVVGVVQDFNYDRINHPIKPFAFRYDTRKYNMMSLKIQSSDMLSTMDKLNVAWKKIDTIHPFKSEFHNNSIQNAYGKLSWMAKIIGSIAFLAIFIASLGLLGMVIFTTEIRLKEISIRKVMGASEVRLILLMSKGFIVLLIVSASIAIPVAYYLFDQIIFSRLAYRAPIGVLDIFGGVFGVIAIALIMIGYQTTKVSRSNPAQVLKSE